MVMLKLNQYLYERNKKSISNKHLVKLIIIRFTIVYINSMLSESRIFVCACPYKKTNGLVR